MTEEEKRRPRYVPVDALVAFSPFGTKLLEKWGMEGLCAWVLLLAAAKREPVQGTFTYSSEVEAWTKLGASAAGFTFDEFITVCGRAKQTRKTRSGRVCYIEIRRWQRWNDAWKTQQNSERKTRKPAVSNATGTLPLRDQYATEVEAEVEDEITAVQAAVQSEFGLPISFEQGLELKRVLAACRDVDEGSFGVLQAEARGLSLGAIARVRESCERKRPRPGVGYAVQALRSEKQAA